MAALQDAVLELLEQKPFEQITIKEITSLAGVSYPTFFRRCAGKAELLNTIATDEVRKLLSLGQHAIAEYDEAASSIAMFTYVNSRRKLWKTLLTGGAKAAIRDEFMRISLSIAATRKYPETKLPIDLAVPLVTGGIIEILTWWLNQPEDCPAERASQFYDELVVAPVMARNDSSYRSDQPS
ncbi:TetR/AcrR family transcriptional regulator [Novosphingobium album (ex Hu et al. 2023)]|uniref:TetR/AcrR family transcriptional regulator n=1 Tax=Novosphingobium album (ex Hu et al. 2023) TaxID=2930093 RepID=A0ABT0B591_9SPHN|nr:helix-turn-helix domain-containing protein [Novosphingobium album (ex Hu et al. 2023)]MCJ2180252.1 TetR/AcrR family transcriptional regulator [Novosphingobium album (ex Hu et al. 2023)]